MGKQTVRTYEEKLVIVQEIMNGKSYSYVSDKYNVLPGKIAYWKRKLLEGTLDLDIRGKKVWEVEDIKIIQKVLYSTNEKPKNATQIEKY